MVKLSPMISAMCGEKGLQLASCIFVACVCEVSGALASQPATAQPSRDNPAARRADYQPSGDYYDWRKTR